MYQIKIRAGVVGDGTGPRAVSPFGSGLAGTNVLLILAALAPHTGLGYMAYISHQNGFSKKNFRVCIGFCVNTFRICHTKYTYCTKLKYP
jgi:hypothetical protein